MAGVDPVGGCQKVKKWPMRWAHARHDKCRGSILPSCAEPRITAETAGVAPCSSYNHMLVLGHKRQEVLEGKGKPKDGHVTRAGLDKGQARTKRLMASWTGGRATRHVVTRRQRPVASSRCLRKTSSASSARYLGGDIKRGRPIQGNAATLDQALLNVVLKHLHHLWRIGNKETGATRRDEGSRGVSEKGLQGRPALSLAGQPRHILVLCRRRPFPSPRDRFACSEPWRCARRGIRLGGRA